MSSWALLGASWSSLGVSGGSREVIKGSQGGRGEQWGSPGRAGARERRNKELRAHTIQGCMRILSYDGSSAALEPVLPELASRMAPCKAPQSIILLRLIVLLGALQGAHKYHKYYFNKVVVLLGSLQGAPKYSCTEIDCAFGRLARRPKVLFY